MKRFHPLLKQSANICETLDGNSKHARTHPQLDHRFMSVRFSFDFPARLPRQEIKSGLQIILLSSGVVLIKFLKR